MHGLQMISELHFAANAGIYLGGCGVGDTGAKELANVAGGSLHLETLCLGHNSIGDEGASALACALSGNQSLRR